MSCYSAWDIQNCGCGAATCSICHPCSIPTETLTLSINGGSPTNLSYSSSTWSDGTHDLSCVSGAMSFIGGGSWTLSSHFCLPLHYSFTLGPDTAVITDPSGLACPQCIPECNACNLVVTGNLSVTDANGTYTAVWDPANLWWGTGFLASAATISPAMGCSPPNSVCRAATADSVIYGYVINCAGPGKFTITRYWFETQGCLTGPFTQYYPYSCVASRTPYPSGDQVISRTANIPLSCSSVSWSGTLTASLGGLDVPDPVTGTTSFSGTPFGVTPSYCYPPFTVTRCLGAVAIGAVINVWDTSLKAIFYGSSTVSSAITLVPVNSVNSTFYYEVSSSGCTTFTGNQNTDPAQPISVTLTCSGGGFCCQAFSSTGCNAVTLLSGGTTYKVYDHVGGTLLATTTSASFWTGSCNIYLTATESSGRFTAFGSAETLTDGSIITVPLSIASGYTCITDFAACGYPAPNTLFCTFSDAGLQTFTFASGSWTASFTYLTKAYVIKVFPDGTMTSTVNGVSFTCTFSLNGCPVVDPFEADINTGTEFSNIGSGTMTE